MKKLSDRKVWEAEMTEEHVFKACRALLELNGARVFRIVERIPWGRKTSEPGTPDAFGWWPEHTSVLSTTGGETLSFGPRYFFIEFKKPGGKHRPSQVAWIERAREDGVRAFFCDSIEALVKGFEEYGIKLKGISQ